MSLALGALDGRVELRELLGSGGMGEVHAAWDQGLARAVAVKFVHGSGSADAERLLLEARLQARVEHPHVVRVFEVGTLAGRPCIVFQLVPGKTLQEVASGLPVADRVELVRQAATGLHAAHLQGLVHRDVKPGNILVEEVEQEGSAEKTRTALVTDFGLAHAEEGGLTRSGLLPGTLDFMAPEQLAGGGPVDFRSDVYALGATLYAVLSGRPPFRIPSARPEASGEGQVRLLRRILDEEPPPLRSIAPELPRELSVIASRAMEKDPGARYPSAEAFADDLHRFQRGEPIRARPPTLGDRAWKWSRRNRAASRSLAATLAILLAAGAFSLWQSRQAGREALEAARLGALAASLETRMRMEYLSPPHDLRPALAEVKREVESLKPLAALRGGGPASYALGKGLELLGDLDAARQAYQRAWDLGFRTPQAAEGLGLALGRVFERERQRAEHALASEPRARRIADLQADLLEPARRALQAADRRGWRAAWLDASLALLAGDSAAATRGARESLAQDPGLYEALLLEGQALQQESVALQGRAKPLEARKAVDQAIGVLERALESGRSDPRVVRALAAAHQWSANILVKSGADPARAQRAALEWLERSGKLDPLDWWSFLFRGQALVDQATHEFDTGRPAAWSTLRQGIGLMRRARELRPRDTHTLALLAFGLYKLGAHERETRQPAAADTLAEGLGAIGAGLALSPSDPLLHLHGMYLQLESARLATDAGKGSAEQFQRVVDAAQAAIRGGTRYLTQAQQTMTNAMLDRALEQWRAGQDPRPGLAEAIQAVDRMATDAPQTLAVRHNQAWVLGSALEILLAAGEDVRALAARGLAVTDDLLRLRPELAAVQISRAEMLLIEARRRVSAGEGAEPAITEAERWIRRSTAGGVEGDNQGQNLGNIQVLRARALAHRGIDPSPLLARGEELYRTMATREPGRAYWHGALSLCSGERATWARRRGRSAGPDARRGLETVARALRLDERDPELWTLQGWLQALAGDRAAARASLDRAYALQPLVRGGREAQAAEKELATAASRP